MKLKEALQTMNERWIRRRQGFRVRFDKRTASRWVTDYFPDKKEKPLTSEVSAWELARRFADSHPLSSGGRALEGDIANISVVDDSDTAVNFYGTNEPRTFNPRDTD